MNFQTLKKALCEANKLGKKVEGYITFTQKCRSSFCSVAGRTYVISSDSKAFSMWSLGKPLFGTTLDKSDLAAPLDRYMQPHDGHHGWEIEDCGLVVYELIATFEHKISVLGTYSSHEAAFHAMRDSFIQTVGGAKDICDYFGKNNSHGEFSANFAWANDVGPEHKNCNWQIVPFLNNGLTLVPVQQVLDNAEAEAHDREWKELKQKLLETVSVKDDYGAILSFLGTDTPIPSDMGALSLALDEAEQQMPEDVFQQFYLQYCFF